MKEDTERLLFDIGAAILLLAVALGGSGLPRYLAKRGRAAGVKRSLMFQLGNMLSAGVMISAGFCHLLADAVEDISEVVDNFPLAHFLCATGFLITLSADQYAMWISKRRPTEATLLPATLTKSDQPMASHEPSLREATESLREGAGDSAASQTLEVEHDHIGDSHPNVSFLTALFLGLALSLHSVLEGLALGAQQTIHSSEDVLIAIAAHKGLAAYALGASLVDSEAPSGRFWKVAGGFSIASPIGIMVGYAISELAEGVGGALLSALASGTFLYVAMMEVIPSELKSGENIFYKILIMFLGFTAMSTLAIWA